MKATAVATLTPPKLGSDIDIKDWVAFARTYTAHPVAALFPMLPPDELEALADSICAYGLMNPIVLDDEMRVVDGRNRLAALLLESDSFDVPSPRFVRFESVKPAKCPGIAEYIVSTNIQRRHLDPDKRAAIVVQAYPHFRETANKARSEKQAVNLLGNKNAAKTSRGQTSTTCSEPAPAPETKRTWEIVAEQADVSERKARQALEVVVHAPELLDKVVSGALPMHKAAKEAKARKADPSPKKKRAPKPLALQKAKDKIKNVIADMLHKLSDDDMRALREWIAGGCK